MLQNNKYKKIKIKIKKIVLISQKSFYFKTRVRANA